MKTNCSAWCNFREEWSEHPGVGCPCPPDFSGSTMGESWVIYPVIPRILGFFSSLLRKIHHPWQPLSLPQYHMVLPLYDTNFMHYLLFKNPQNLMPPPKNWLARQVKSVQHFCGSNLKKLSGQRISVVPHRRYLHHPCCERFFHKRLLHPLKSVKGGPWLKDPFFGNEEKINFGTTFFLVDDSRSF